MTFEIRALLNDKNMERLLCFSRYVTYSGNLDVLRLASIVNKENKCFAVEFEFQSLENEVSAWKAIHDNAQGILDGYKTTLEEDL